MKYIPLALVLCCAPAMATGIYKWVDENGQVHYGERPAGSQAEQVHIRTNETVTRPDSIRKKTDEELAEDAETNKEQEADGETTGEAAKPPVEKVVPQYEKNRLCREGKADYQNISNRGRMREIDAQGNYRYLSDQERNQRIARAKSKMRKYCY